MAPPKQPKKPLKSMEKPIEKPIMKSKKSKKKNYQSFSIYLYKVLRSLGTDNLGISKKSMLVMNSFVNDMLEMIAAEAGRLVAHGKRTTLSSREIQTAIKLLIPGELARHANIEVPGMILYQNWEVFVSFLFYSATKIICYMLDMLRQNTLSSIPERNEEGDVPNQKWVPKKKHEVLKAKYKCLKKLFQIYDASIIGITEPNVEYEDDTRTYRRKRSHRTKTDACAGTELSDSQTELSHGNESVVTELSISKESADTELTRVIKQSQSCSTQSENSECDLATKVYSKLDKYAETRDAISMSEKEQDIHHPVPCLILNERRKLTRFQCFVQRLFGRRDDFILSNNTYAASDSQRERQRKRGLRFRRLRRSKKIKSDSDLKTLNSPAILSYVQSVQRNCLLDTTPRQCPIMGCRMMLYGIINYNDHLNLCHFKDRKYICHYCHEGFEKDYDKFAHENEHIGLNKLSANTSNSSTSRNALASNSITQTDEELTIADEKLKKIVSFFDKISNDDEIVAKIRKSRNSEANLTHDTESNNESHHSSDNRTVSCMNIRKGKCKSSNSSEAVSNPSELPISCRTYSNFNYRRQFNLHIDQHRVDDKFSKNKSCPGMCIPSWSRAKEPFTPRRDGVEPTPRRDGYGECLPRSRGAIRRNLVSQDGRLNVLSIDSSRGQSFSGLSTVTPSEETLVTRDKSLETLTCDPSTNIVYHSSMPKNSAVGALMKKVRSYKWEPETKIIHV